MKSKTVTITVSGDVGTGKPTICKIIQNALKEYGVKPKVIYENEDDKYYLRNKKRVDDVMKKLHKRKQKFIIQDVYVRSPLFHKKDWIAYE
jgi:uridine kinase